MTSIAVGAALIVSPHLDDAVLSCGRLIVGRPGSVVVTFVASVPAAGGALRVPWETRYCELEGKFPDSRSVALARRAEDEKALAHLGARSEHLNAPDLEALLRMLQKYPEHPLFIPLGLGHSDHIRLSDGLLARLPGTRGVVLYRDFPYSLRDPNAPEARLTELAKRFSLSPADLITPRTARKGEAIRMYATEKVGMDKVFPAGWDSGEHEEV